MIFGEDGERRAQQRAAAQRQYAEELKAQIAERQTRNPAPRPIQPPEPAPQRPPSLLAQAQSPQQGPAPITLPKSGQGRPAAAVSPLLEALPDLPAVATGLSPDVVRFADRLNWLEGSLEQHHGILTSASESASRIERVTLPSLNDGVAQLRAAIDRIAQVDLPGRLRPLEDENQRLEEKISATASEYSQNAQALRDSLGQLTSAFSQTQSRFGEFSDSVKATLNDFKAELGQNKDMHDSILQRISQAESRASQTEENMRSVDQALQQFEKSTAEGIANAQKQANSMVSNSSSQLAQELKAESEERDKAITDLHAKTEDANQKAAEGLTSVQNTINELAASFRQSLDALSTSVREGLEATRNRSDQQYKDLTTRLDDLLTRTESNFNSIQNESVQTLEVLNDQATKTRDELEKALTQECETRQQNEAQIVQRYDNFKSVIVNEMKLQTSQMEKLSEDAKRRVIQKCNDAVTPIKQEIAELRQKTHGADVLPQRVQQIEQIVEALNSQLISNVGSLGKQSSKIVSRLDKLQKDSDQTITHFNDRLANIGKHRSSKPDFVTRDEVTRAFQKLNAQFEARVAKLEQQIDSIDAELSKAVPESS